MKCIDEKRIETETVNGRKKLN